MSAPESEAGRGGVGERASSQDPSGRSVGSDPRAELVVITLLAVAAVCSLAFAALVLLSGNTQLLGLSIGLALAALAVATVLAGKRMVPQETVVEERPRLARAETAAEVDRLVREGGEGVSRRKLIAGAACVAGASLGVGLVAPAASLGPAVGDRVAQTPWRAGRGLVDEEGAPLMAADIEIGSFHTALAAGADRRDLGAAVVVVRLDPSALELPAGREGWAPLGILAFSKICTHAACAVALYRHPKYEPVSERPALVCPCHFSTFDPARGAEPIFGPAARALPQLPLRIDAQGRLVAAGGYSAPIGPAWLGVRRA